MKSTLSAITSKAIKHKKTFTILAIGFLLSSCLSKNLKNYWANENQNCKNDLQKIEASLEKWAGDSMDLSLSKIAFAKSQSLEKIKINKNKIKKEAIIISYLNDIDLCIEQYILLSSLPIINANNSMKVSTNNDLNLSSFKTGEKKNKSTIDSIKTYKNLNAKLNYFLNNLNDSIDANLKNELKSIKDSIITIQKKSNDSINKKLNHQYLLQNKQWKHNAYLQMNEYLIKAKQSEFMLNKIFSIDK